MNLNGPDIPVHLPPLLVPAPTRIALGDNGALLDGEALAWIQSHDPAVHEVSTPRQITCRVTGGWCGAGSVDAQSYRLRIERSIGDSMDGRIVIESPSSMGVRFARATLRQLVGQYGGALPRLDIEDRPAFATRGVMLDVSRCRIPTMDEFRRIVDSLSDLKCNHLQLYTEHTFAYAGHEAVWRGWDPITPGEARELDAYCTSRGIELAANQNCFGHLAQWLKHPKYTHLAETHGDWVFDVWPRSGPFSLCPTDDASLEFVEDLLGQLLPCFSGGLVNIGCDETYDIAYGRSKSEVSQRGRAAVYMEFVEKVCSLVREHGKRPMFWGDIALSHPECAKDIPEDAIALAWGYEPDSPFDQWCDVLGKAGREAWVCPGTSSWCSITGRTSERRANIENAARQGAAGGATGFLVCDWGDFGHWQQWPVSMRGIADGLGAAWAGTLPDTRAVALHGMGDRSFRATAWLDTIGDADLSLRESCLGLSRPGQVGRLRNQSALFADMRVPLRERTEIGSLDAWLNALRSLQNDGLAPWRGGWRASGAPALVRKELMFTRQLAVAACTRAVVRRGGGGSIADARELFGACREAHGHLWRSRSRPGGLAQSNAFFDMVIAELEVATC